MSAGKGAARSSVRGRGCSYGFYDETSGTTNKKGDEVRRFLTLSQKEAGKT